MFAAGYSLECRVFFYNIYYILLFGLVSTVVNFGITVAFSYLINQGGVRLITDYGTQIELDDTDILLYSATICSTDSVAALAMIDPIKYPKLFSVIFGEGMVP